ncbi:MAG TPA: cyclase family protein [Thermoanaerobaculia bacterium]|nr:cyclase family protein [Thermoanaerobaculia bacterium]
MRLIDLSLPIRSGPPGAPQHQRVALERSPHAEGARQIQALFGLPPELLRDGEGWAVERFTSLGTHNVTHLDAPFHYNSTIDGRPARTIDQLPLDWFLAPGVVLDMRHKPEGEAVTVADVEQALEGAGHELCPRDIVLVHTGYDRFAFEPDYMTRGCGVSAEATLWLHLRGVRVMGIDAWGWDRPLQLQAREALERGETGVFWAAHQAGIEYSQIERLTNLGALPPTGFTVVCFPLRVEGGSGAPARVVAMVEEG